MKKKTKYLTAAALLGSASWVTASYFSFRASTLNLKKAARKQRDLDYPASDPWVLERQWYQQQPRLHRQIQTADGLTLQAILLPQAQATTKVAILAHGYHHSLEQMAPYAKLFYDLGFNVLVPDARSHGDSDGRAIGFGWLDRRDYVRWAQLMTQEFGQTATVVLFGISMGAATVLAASGEADLPHTVKAVIEDSAFSSVAKEVYYRMWSHYYLPAPSLMPLMTLFAKRQAGYAYREGNILRQIKKSQTPTLFIHGGQDCYVPPKAFNQLYHGAPMRKMAYFVPQADHVQAYATNRARYEDTIRHFLTELRLL